MTHKCPHCGARLRLAVFPAYKQQRQQNSRPGEFRHTVTRPPTSVLALPFWLLFGWGAKQVELPDDQKVIVRVEEKASKQKILIRELAVNASPRQLMELADVYLRLGYDWSRETTASNSRITGYRHNKITQDFKRLGFLDKTDNGYNLNDAGRRFLRHYLV